MDTNIPIKIHIKSPIEKLKIAQDAPLDQFSVLTSLEEIEELKEYVRAIAYDPVEIKDRIKKLLLLYVAAVRFIISSLEEEDYQADSDLLVHCDSLAKTLYTLYKDVNIILISKDIEHVWRDYTKLRDRATKLPEVSTWKLESSRDRLFHKLAQICNRIKLI